MAITCQACGYENPGTPKLCERCETPLRKTKALKPTLKKKEDSWDEIEAVKDPNGEAPTGYSTRKILLLSVLGLKVFIIIIALMRDNKPKRPVGVPPGNGGGNLLKLPPPPQVNRQALPLCYELFEPELLPVNEAGLYTFRIKFKKDMDELKLNPGKAYQPRLCGLILEIDGRKQALSPINTALEQGTLEVVLDRTILNPDVKKPTQLIFFVQDNQARQSISADLVYIAEPQ
jgi:hypothetical protein